MNINELQKKSAVEYSENHNTDNFFKELNLVWGLPISLVLV